MADRFCAQITIGGRLTRRRLPRFLKAIADSRGSLEWGDAPFQPASADELTAALSAGRLVLCDDQARFGEFENLEAACRRLHLAYTRHSESRYEFEAELVDWRPGMREPIVRMCCSNSQNVLVWADFVQEALDHLKARRYRKALTVLQWLLPTIPELPPLEIVPQIRNPALSAGRRRPCRPSKPT